MRNHGVINIFGAGRFLLIVYIFSYTYCQPPLLSTAGEGFLIQDFLRHCPPIGICGHAPPKKKIMMDLIMPLHTVKLTL